MRFNHMELTFARGTLTDEFRDEVDAFYGARVRLERCPTPTLSASVALLHPDADQFILLAQSGKPMSSPGFDHLGLLQDTWAEVDDLLEACKRYREKDDLVHIQEYEDLVYPHLTIRAFDVKYLLPISSTSSRSSTPSDAVDRLARSRNLGLVGAFFPRQ